jgi:endonuclease YncB( thermonuclease family)
VPITQYFTTKERIGANNDFLILFCNNGVMKKIRICLSLISLVVIAGMSFLLIEKNESENDVVGIKKDDIPFSVTKVIDGDTIMVEIDGLDKRVRLIGIDSPELVHPGKEIECFSREASNKMQELVSGKFVVLKSDPTQENEDKYGRLLRYVYTLEGMDINFTMIEQGYAFEYTYVYPYEKQNIYKNAERYAKENKLGLWNPEYCQYH